MDDSERLPAGPRKSTSGLIELWYVAYLLIGLAVYGLAVILMPLVVAAAGHRPFRVGAVVALQNLGLLSAPVWGQFMDRFGRHRLVLVAGSLLIAAGFAGLSVWTGLSSLLACACMIGIGTAAATTSTLLFVVGLKPEGEWSDRIGTLQLFNSIGTTIGLAFAGLLPVHVGTGVGAAAAFLSAILVRMTLPAAAARAGGAIVRDAHPADAMPPPPLSSLASLLCSWFLLILGVSCFASLYPIVMRQVFAMHIGTSSSVLSIATLAGLPLYAVSGLLIRRLGSSLVFAGGAACRCLCLVALCYLSWRGAGGQRMLLFLSAGIFQACWPIISVSANERLFRSSCLGRGLSSGIFTFVGALASAAGALLSGAVADRYGYPSILPAAAALCALGLLLAVQGHASTQRMLRAQAASPGASCV